jgi:PadR family transcriptional regulator, regulatory protein PadR
MAAKLLTDFELMVLLAVLRLDDEAYGVPIAREIEETAKRPVVRAVVYASLERLQERGLVRSTLGEPTAERGGKAKRYYRVSPAGLKAVRDTQRALVALWTGIPQLKGGLA